ncbi:MAG TPA: hypothetical protein PKD22_09850, partial [Chitinophagales bacterium]|nr:hypothetical protein [Chitinophagales bacterium]
MNPTAKANIIEKIKQNKISGLEIILPINLKIFSLNLNKSITERYKVTIASIAATNKVGFKASQI